MNRRKFLESIGLLVGGIAIEQAIPKSRVWSFPNEIRFAQGGIVPACDYVVGQSPFGSEVKIDHTFKRYIHEYDPSCPGCVSARIDFTKDGEGLVVYGSKVNWKAILLGRG
jgi:hypothetical protein